MRAIHGCAFDMEGTVVDLERFHFDYGFVPAARDLGLPDITVEIIHAIPRAIGGGDQVIAEGISALSNGKISVPELRKLKMEYYNQAIKDVDMRPREGFRIVNSKGSMEKLTVPLWIFPMPGMPALKKCGFCRAIVLFNLSAGSGFKPEAMRSPCLTLPLKANLFFPSVSI